MSTFDFTPTCPRPVKPEMRSIIVKAYSYHPAAWRLCGISSGVGKHLNNVKDPVSDGK